MLLLAPLVTLACATSASGAVVFGVYTQRLPRETGPALDGFALETGVKPQIAMYYQDWKPDWSTALINPRIVGPAVARGATPMITWEPFLSNGTAEEQKPYALGAIAAGADDAFIWRAANEAAAFGRPFFLRLAHEMNGDWSPWGVTSGNTPALYVAMWRHVVSIFRAAGATNVRWVWSPNVNGAAGVAPFQPYYPGDFWVDDVALDGYNWGPVKSSPWLSFAALFGPSYEALARMTSKPIMIGETGSTELGGNKALWIAGIRKALAERMPKVRALIWFDLSKEADWTLDSSSASLRAFRGLAQAGMFSGQASQLTNPTLAAARGVLAGVWARRQVSSRTGMHPRRDHARHRRHGR